MGVDKDNSGFVDGAELATFKTDLPKIDTDKDGKLDLTETWNYTATHTVTQDEIDSNGGGDGKLAWIRGWLRANL